MERREFLKIFGLGAAAIGVAAATMTPAQAASTLTSEPAMDGLKADSLISEMAAANGETGEFAQYYYYRRRPRYYYRSRYYVRRRRCWLRETPWGWRRVCG